MKKSFKVREANHILIYFPDLVHKCIIDDVENPSFEESCLKCNFNTSWWWNYNLFNEKQTFEIYKGPTKIPKYYEFCILARWLFILRILYVAIMNTNRSKLRVLLKLCWKDYLHLKKKLFTFFITENIPMNFFFIIFFINQRGKSIYDFSLELLLKSY